MKKTILTLLFLISNLFLVRSQEKKELSLEEAIEIASRESDNAFIARYDSLIFNLQYKEFKTRALPQIKLSSKPYISQDITSVTLDDGSEKYVNRRLANLGVNISLSQLVPFTGGELVLSSSVNGLENYAPNQYKSFYFNWLNIAYKQTLGNYNEYKWNKRIFDSQRDIEKLKHIQALEELKFEVACAYLEYYAQQALEQHHGLLLDIAELKNRNSKYLYGFQRMTKEDVINNEIEYQQELIDSQKIFDDRSSEMALKDLLKLPDSARLKPCFDDSLYLSIPENYNLENLVERAIVYNVQTANNHQYLERHKAIAKNDFNSGVTWGIDINAGMNKSERHFSAIFGHPENQYKVALSISIPILDWGEASHRKKRLETELRLSLIKGSKEEDGFEISTRKEIQEISYLVKNLKVDKKLLSLQLDRIAILKEKLNADRIQELDFIKAKSGLLNSSLNYNSNLKRLVFLIYKYRYVSLWDILNNRPII
jgi:outer membrane protein TolC